jgi:hypothetical protein
LASKLVAMVSSGLTSKLVVTVSSGLASKPAVTVSDGLTSKPAVTVLTGLASKPVAVIFSSLTSKLVATVSLNLTSKPVFDFLVELQNQGGGGFSDLGLKTGTFDFVIWASNSPRQFFGLGIKTKQASICRLRHKTDGGRRRGTRVEI